MSRTSLRRTRAFRRIVAAICLALATLFCAAAAADACSWDYRIWMPTDKNADPLYRFIRDGKAGYIDRAGKVVVEPKFEPRGNYGGVFHDGLAEMGVSSGEYVDSTGKALDFGLYRGWDFSDGLAAALAADGGKWGYIDRTGKFAISPRFEGHPRGYVHSFSDGLAWIEESGRWGFIDRAGDFVVGPTFLRGEAFRDGMARVVVEGPCSFFADEPCASPRLLGGEAGPGDVPACKVTFVDRHGAVLAQRFDGAKDFSEGLAPVRKGEKWGFVDKSGKVIIEPRFDEAWPFSDGLARVMQGGRYGYIDAGGRVRIPVSFKEAGEFSDGLAAVTDRDGDDDNEAGYYYYIDRGGRVRIPGPFAVASDFFKGLAHVRLRDAKGGRRAGRFAYIDAAGKKVFTYTVERDED